MFTIDLNVEKALYYRVRNVLGLTYIMRRIHVHLLIFPMECPQLWINEYAVESRDTYDGNLIQKFLVHIKFIILILK